MIAIRHVFAASAVVFALAATASAQPAEGAIVSGSIGATVLNSETNLSFAASAGYRFNRAMALVLEIGVAPSTESRNSFGIPVPIPYGVAGPSVRSNDRSHGSLTTLSTNVRLEMPLTTRHVLPYFVAGGGVANLEERYSLIYSFVNLPAAELAAFGLTTIAVPPITQSYTQSTTEMVLNLGGGVSILKGDHLSFDVDLRYLHLLGNQGRDIGRFGAGVSYRF